MQFATLEEERNASRDEIVEDFRRISRLRLIEAKNRCRPSVILRPRLTSFVNARDELVYVAAYGDLFCGGSTPDEAYEQFDRAWVEGI